MTAPLRTRSDPHGNPSESTGFDTRIAIVGAGCSGITAAYKLHELGYRNITLYEANERIGGKIQSTAINGHVVELGAVWSVQHDRTVFEMAEKLGFQRFKEVKEDIVVLLRQDDGAIEKLAIEHYWGNASTISVASGLLAFWRIVWLSKFKKVFKPGFHDLHDDLITLTTTEFARKHKFHPILDLFLTSAYACGYGSMDEIPAAYMLKMMKTLEQVRCRRQMSWGHRFGLYTFKGGFQSFWERVVGYLTEQGIDVHLGTPLERVVRPIEGNGRHEIEVFANGQTKVFDRLVISTSPHQTMQYIDATENEKELFGRVSYFKYHSVAFQADGISGDDCVLLQYNMKRDRHGRLFCYREAAPRSRIFVGYQLNDVNRSDDELDELLCHDVTELGGQVSRIFVRQTWKFFPHVKLQDLDADYYPRLNALQGQNGTYYLGGLFAFESIEHCAQFAEFMVNRFHQNQWS